LKISKTDRAAITKIVFWVVLIIEVVLMNSNDLFPIVTATGWLWFILPVAITTTLAWLILSRFVSKRR